MKNMLLKIMEHPQAIIEKAERQDIKRLTAISEANSSHHIADYYANHFDYVDEGKRLILINSCDGQDVGYCIYNRFPKYTLFRKLEIPEIQDLNTIPAYRKRGLGSQMIEYCENLAREEGYISIGIGVSVAPNFGAAQRLYISRGYIPDGNGATYDRKPTASNEFRPLDEQLCLMLIKDLK